MIKSGHRVNARNPETRLIGGKAPGYVPAHSIAVVELIDVFRVPVASSPDIPLQLASRRPACK